jgi:hypothetical protein
VAALATLTLASLGCGGGSRPPAKPAAASSDDPIPLEIVTATPAAAPKPAPEATKAVTIPTSCASQQEGFCLPPKEFVAELCNLFDPNVGLTMLRKGTPWTRVYVRRNEMEAWYASGGRSRPAKLRFGEELAVIAVRGAAAGGVQVSGSGSYDALRWDGTCVSLMSDEIARFVPAVPEVAPIPWQRLDADMQEALEKNAKVKFKNESRRSACQAVGPGADKKCATAEQGLARMIGDFVRSGGEIPTRTALMPPR